MSKSKNIFLGNDAAIRDVAYLRSIKVTWIEIAKKYGIMTKTNNGSAEKASQFYNKATIGEKYKSKNPEKPKLGKERKCLRCGKMFIPECKGFFMHKSCRDSATRDIAV